MLDLNAFGNGGARGTSRRVSPVESRSVTAKAVKDNSPEAKAAKAFLNAMNVLSFDPARFAFIFARADLIIQKRALSTLIAVVDTLASLFDTGIYNDPDELEFYYAAKKASESLAPFRLNP